MKKKSKYAVAKKKKEFRFHGISIKKPNGVIYDLLHPTFVFLEKGNQYYYMTITHSDRVNGFIVIKLKKNPNPCDQKDSYIVLDVRFDTKDRFSAKRNNWKIDDEDDQIIRDAYMKYKNSKK